MSIWRRVALSVPAETRGPLCHALEAAAALLGGFDFPNIGLDGIRRGTSRIEPGDAFETAGVDAMTDLAQALQEPLPAEAPCP